MDEARPTPGHGADGTGRAAAGWPRSLFVGFTVLAFAGAFVSASSRWDRLVDALLEAPAPTALVTPTREPAPPDTGERAISEARSKLERGDAPGAIAALDSVSPDQPAYPFARRLRSHVETLHPEGRTR